MIETGLGGRIVIITGAATGIGKATALRFAQEGARVVGWDINSETSREFAGELQQAGGSGTLRSVDVSRSNDVNAAVDAATAEYGTIDVLINNAGIIRDAQLIKARDGEIAAMMSDEDWASVIDVNLSGTFHTTRAVAKKMIASGRGGVILNASSVVGLYGNFGQTNYVASKAGVIGMTKVWARELGRYGIRVNAVAPGIIDTEMTQQMPESIRSSMVQRTPIRRMGRVEDIANAYLWLASEAASFVHGAVLSVDGGVVTGT